MQTRNIAGKKSIITKSYAGNEGKIVTCIRLATEEEANSVSGMLHQGKPFWVVDKHLPSFLGGKHSFVGDFQMTPLQDLDEPEQQVQELYAPSPKTKKVLDKVK